MFETWKPSKKVFKKIAIGIQTNKTVKNQLPTAMNNVPNENNYDIVTKVYYNYEGSKKVKRS